MDKTAGGNGRDPREVVTQQTYDMAAKKYAHTRCGKGAWREELHFFWSLLEQGGKPKRILDLGCGSARVLQHALAEHEPLAHYVGVDFSDSMLREAIQWNIQSGAGIWLERRDDLLFLEPGLLGRLHGHFQRFFRRPRLVVDLVHQRLQDIDPPAEYFDAVMMLASFHHLLTREEQETLLELANYTLCPGALLCMTNWHLQKGVAKNARQHGSVWEIPFDGAQGGARFYYAFTEKELTQLLLYAGFDDIRHRIAGGNIVTTAVKQ